MGHASKLAALTMAALLTLGHLPTVALANTWDWNGHMIIPRGGVDVYIIENNQKHYIGSMDIVGCLGGYSQVIGVDPSELQGWPTGTPKNDCNALPAARVYSSETVTVYSTSGRNLNAPDVQMRTVIVPQGSTYLGHWWRETTANPRPSGGAWTVRSGVTTTVNGQTAVWVETSVLPNRSNVGTWVGVDFTVQWTN